MEDEGSVAVAPGRRHIIRRPRLTRLLDESAARVILLVAPAGYGKTTLAQEWTGVPGRRSAWYGGGPASADVAALAVGLAEAAATVAPDAGKRMRERLRVSDAPERDVRPLAELLAEDLAQWPEDAWLVIDDYHFAMESATSEEFVDLLATLAPLRLLVTSRHRPSWATARRILYGELHELGPNQLAMNDDEAGEVLSRRKGKKLPGLLALAEGWPAVIGLAALASDFELPEEDLPARLYDYFAEELYQKAEPQVRCALCKLALTPAITKEVGASLFGPETAESILREGVRVGFLTLDGKGSYDLHPLLRSFLDEKLREHVPDSTAQVVAEVGGFLLSQKRWDHVFSIVQRFGTPDLLVALAEAALDAMLLEGRLATLGRWLEHAHQHHVEAPVLELAQAEIDFRQGLHQKAETLALRAARQLAPQHPMVCRAFIVAGRAAHHDNRQAVARRYHERARELAADVSDIRQALWGQFVCAIELESEDALRILEELDQHQGDRAEDFLRASVASVHVGMKLGDLDEAVQRSRSGLHIVSKATDPVVRSSFLNAYSNALSLIGHYAEALSVATREIEDAQHYRLGFVLPHAYLNKAVAELGLRRFVDSKLLIDRAEEASIKLCDTHASMNARAIQSRLFIAQGAFDRALSTVGFEPESIPGKAIYGEYLSCRALALACTGRRSDALEAAAIAERTTKTIEVGVLIPCIRAIVALASHAREAGDLARQAFEAARRSGNVDSLIAAYRGYPPLLLELARDGSNHPRLSQILWQACDKTLARQARISLPHEPGMFSGRRLSKREQEVYELVAQGFANKQIAKTLYISEVTVKAHLRHIFAKLGVRSRTEAALRAAAEHIDYAAPIRLNSSE